ncbi:putative ribonuclease H-like domain-containing protein [Tanacetum coccineum]
MQEELLQFKLQKVWTLVDLPKGKRAIGTKWVYRNKKDERGIVIRNKARLVAQGSAQEEGIDYDEVFAPVARIEAIRLFLAYASFMMFIVYQMDVKSAFLYGTIEEDVYVCQPRGFEDPQFPDKVYKVYVDDIIFGSTKKSLCDEFEQIMHNKFQMSSMGELTFFLGLQVQQKKDGIFISQEKYVVDILKKFDFITVKTASTPMEPNKALVKDEEADSVDVHLYRSMIRSLMYLIASRPDITFAFCAYTRFQVTPKTSHHHVVKRIFRYLKGRPKLGLWYPRDSPCDLEAFSDSDYARASLDRKSTTRGLELKDKKELAIPEQTTTGKEFLNPLMADSLPKTISAKTRSERVLEKPNEPPLPEGYTSKSREGSMEHTFELMDTVPPTPHDSPLTGGYTPRSDKAVEILKLKQRVKKLERKRKSSISHLRRGIYRQVESFDDDLDEEDASKQGRISDKTKLMFKDSDFDDLDDLVDEGMAFGVSIVAPRTPLTTTIVFDDEDLTMAMAQTLIKMKEEKAKEKGVAIKDVEDFSRPIRSITTLQPLPTIDPKDKGKSVLVEEEPKKPEKVKRRDQGLAQIESDAELAQRLHEEELAELDIAQKKQEEATNSALAEEFDEIQARMDADHELAVRLTHEEKEKYTIEERATLLAEYFKRRKKQLAAERAEAIRNKPPTRAQDVTMAMAQTLIKMEEEKDKEKGVAIKDVEDFSRPIRLITTLQPLPTIDPKEKCKGLLVEEEPEKPEKVKRRDQGLAQIEKFDEIQARMDADHELAVTLTHEEQEKHTIKERATLLAEYVERRKKQLAAERAKAIRNKPPTRSQVRNRMITYLKYMGKYTHQQLKHKTLEELQKLYQKEQKWINDIKPMDSEEDGSNTKKAGKRIKRIADSTSKQKSPKKSKVIKEQESAESNEEAAADYKQEKEELRMWLAVVLDEDETVDLEILSVKADGNTSYHKTFSSMLRKFDRQDLMDLHRLVMKRFEDNTLEGYNLLLWGDLKVMFEPNAEDEIWIEKRYPLIKEMLKKMLNWKLEAEAESTMAFELLKFIKSQVLKDRMREWVGGSWWCIIYRREEWMRLCGSVWRSREDKGTRSQWGCKRFNYRVEEQALDAMVFFERARIIRKRCLQIMKEALEQSFSLFEFWGFSSFDRWKLVEVGNRVKSVVINRIIFHSLVDSLAGERNHHMVHKLEVIGQRIRVIGLNVLEESSKKHGIRESHFTTLGYTYHSMSNVVGKIEGLPIGEAIKHITQACVRMIFVSAETYDDEDGTNLFINVKKEIEANCRKGVAKIRFIFEKVRKDDTTFMEEASHERLVDLPFITGEASGTMIHGDVVCGVEMINLNGIRHSAPKESNEEAAADYEQEKEELRMWLAVVPDEDETVDPEILFVKYPIVDWESQNLGSVDMEDIRVYKIIRADRNTSYHKTFSSMLRKFDRQDFMDLHRLVIKRVEDNTPKGYNLLLWGDLKVMFEPNAEDEIWSNQQDWTLIS